MDRISELQELEEDWEKKSKMRDEEEKDWEERKKAWYEMEKIMADNIAKLDLQVHLNVGMFPLSNMFFPPTLYTKRNNLH